MTPDGHRDRREPVSYEAIIITAIAVSVFGAGVIVWEWLAGLWHRRQA